jgi:hypothetical protein
MFASPYFRLLHVRIARITVSWDAVIQHRSDLPRADTWIRTAELSGVRPLVALSFTRGCYTHSGQVPHLARCQLPSVAAYKRAFLAFRHRYPEVVDWSVWNEANHHSEPTYNNPRRAAEFFNVARAHCPGCNVVAADVLDQRGFLGWLAQFRHYAKHPRLWGVHNYHDTAGHTSSGTRALLKAVPGEVWFTETGGIVHFGHGRFRPRHAASAVRYMFKLGYLSKRITRMYIYQWTGARITDRFDAGVTSPHGRPRPAYRVIRRYLAHHPQPAFEPAGPTGPSGPSGPSGVTGPSGPSGPSGPTGSTSCSMPSPPQCP